LKQKKICVITGTRAEYGIMYWLIKAINDDPNLELQLLVTGMHMSPEFGLTYKDIEKQNIPITKKIEVLLSSDTAVGISKSMGLSMISFAEVFQEIQPDLCVVLGDRFEIFSAVSAAMIARVPVAHLHGGESTEGVIDEAIRHSITKMSHLHFVATKEYAKRVIQLGEHPDNVFNFGSPGIDNIHKLDLLSKNDFEKSIDFELGEVNFLVTFHPVTLEKNTSKEQFLELLNAFDTLKEAKIIFTLPNSDTDGRIIIEMINNYVAKNGDRTIAFQSLGQLRYLSALKYMSAVIGNSSSGLSEVPTFKIPTINIGDRQNGRLKATSVIDCEPKTDAILESIKKAKSNDFQKKLRDVLNPYGKAGASLRIKEKIKSFNIEGILKKKFFNI